MTEHHNQWLLARPQIDARVAADIAARHFGVAGEATELGSQQDRNYQITGRNDRLLLKFDHPDAPAERRSLQRLVIDALVAAGVPTPQLLSIAGGEAAELTATTADGQTVAVRGFGWVEGAALEAEPATSGARAEQLGELAGRTAVALAAAGARLADAALASAAVSVPSQWELGNALAVIEGLIRFLPEAQRLVCLEAARTADAAVRANAHELPSQVIHGDLTTDNVMRDEDGNLWVIDLGDAGFSWRVAEIAVTAADVLGRTGSLAQVARAVRGFADVLRDIGSPLTDAECRAIWPLLVLRGATLAVSGWSQLDIDPGNDYARERMSHEWRVFAEAIAVDAAEALAQLRVAAGLPHSPGLSYGPLVQGVATVIDLGVESELFDRGTWLEPDAEQRRIAEQRLVAEQRRMAGQRGAPEADALVFVARFGEARMSRVPGRISEVASPRARCVELWAPVGTEIRAPFAGVVTPFGAADHTADRIADRAADLAAGIDVAADSTQGFELESAGVVLRVTGVRFADVAGQVAVVAPGAFVARAGEGPIRVTRRIASASYNADAPGAPGAPGASDGPDVPDAPGVSDVSDVSAAGVAANTSAGSDTTHAFTTFDGEYETDWALDPSPLLGLGIVAAADPELARLREQVRRNDAMGGAAERFYADPPRIERGWRSLLIETRGRAYLDMVNNVAAIGHSNPVLADRVARQLLLLNTNSRFLYRAYADFTEKLLSHVTAPELDVVIPVNSGSEALDLAIRMARVATGRDGIVAAREGYHGWTMASDAVSTSAFDNPHAAGSRPDWVHICEAPNAYRGPHRGAGAGAAYVADLTAQLEALAAAGTPAAGFVCEPVLGNAGGVIPPEGYLAAAYDAVRAHGGLAIADEVQVGYGRLGHAFFGHEMLGARPDIIAVAKAAGNAYPVGAVITSRRVVDALAKEGMFFSSAGGAPASAIAATAVLDEIDRQGLQRNALEVGEYLHERLGELASRHRLIGAVHGTGLYQGVELVTDRAALTPARDATAWVCEQMLHEGVIVQPASERQNVLKVKPPMTLSLAEAGDFIAALDRVLARVPAELS